MRLADRLPDDGVLYPDVLEDDDDGQPLSPPNEESLKATDEIHRLPDGSVIEAQDPPSLPSPSASATATERSRNAPKPEVQIQYFIITARTPRLAYTRWPEGALRDKTLGAIFNDVATYTSKKNIRKIWFKLDTSKAEIKYPIHSGDESTFDDMKIDFYEGVEMDRMKGNVKFKIWLEPDPAGQGSTEAEVLEGSESEHVIV